MRQLHCPIELAGHLGQPLPHIQTLTPTLKPTQKLISTPTTLHPVKRASPQSDPLPRVTTTVVAPTNQPPQVLIITPSTPRPRVVVPTITPTHSPQHTSRFTNMCPITPSSTMVYASAIPYAPLQSPQNSTRPNQYKVRKSKRQPKTMFKVQEAICLTTQTAIYVDTGILNKYHRLLKSSKGTLWETRACEEWDCLAQGCPAMGIPVTENTITIKFISITDIPYGKKAAYPRILIADQPQKQQPRRVQVTFGGDQIHYPHNVSTKTSSLATLKLLLNSATTTKWIQNGISSNNSGGPIEVESPSVGMNSKNFNSFLFVQNKHTRA
jgi:hypothetical protein